MTYAARKQALTLVIRVVRGVFPLSVVILL